ncbi:S8 family serine peptidase [Planctomicrobium sp. SH668]|uniref:S8 family serine peptidase n=1 Tax=Planctomicrobium sp. SH668 TaxID=3448126 RepID=UPI003F5B92E6
MISRIAFLFALSLSTLVLAGEPHWEVESGFPTEGILPKSETGAMRFLESHPESDGRGIIVAIFDTGVDPAAPGLQTTPQGELKILDLVDATGDGDVAMTPNHEAVDGELKGLTGRSLKVGADFKNPSGNYFLGMKAGYDIFPEELVSRLKKERKDEITRTQQGRIVSLRDQLKRGETKSEEEGEISKAELESRLKALQEALDSFDDPGPVYDCVVFHDGEQWRAVIDTNENGDLGDEVVLGNYSIEHQHASFGQQSLMNFSVNIYEEGHILSIVTTSGDHGTHVAGIVAAYDEQRPERNGLAPGVQIISVKIGDGRMGSMESGTALVRGLRATLQNRCDMINMSYGEASGIANHGAVIEKFNEIVREHGVIFVAAAGNNGPALTTVGSPGGTTSAVIGVGAYVSPAMMEAEYALKNHGEGQAYTWTSRGPTVDGDTGVDLFAPGGAFASIPNYSLSPFAQMNGTSMASPNACGNIALMLSALKQSEQTYSPISVLRSLQATAERLDGIEELAQGPGLVQIDRAFEHHSEWQAAAAQHVELEVSVSGPVTGRGVLLREKSQVSRVLSSNVSISPYFARSVSTEIKLGFELPVRLVSSADWVQCGDFLLLNSGGESFPITVDPIDLEPGLHVAEIVGLDAEHPERGPLFRVPVTVIKSEDVDEEFRFEAEFDSSIGSVNRRFISVPAGATTAKIRLKQNGGSAPTVYNIHALQIVPGRAFTSTESEFRASLVDGREVDRMIPVIPGRTLEVCVAQWWESRGEASLQLEVSFSGIQSDASRIALSSRGEAFPVVASANLGTERLQPSCSLTSWTQGLAPVSSNYEQLDEFRDGLWDSLRTTELRLDYRLEQVADGQVTVSVPAFEELLYDSPIDSLQVFVIDQNQQVIHSDDFRPESFHLKKGTYTVVVLLRDTDRSELELFEELSVAVKRNLSESIKIPVSSNLAESLLGESDVGETTLFNGMISQFYLRLPLDSNFPKEMASGDQLSGMLYLTNSRVTGVPVTGFYSGGTGSEAESTKSEHHSSEPDLDKAQLNFWMSTLKAQVWPAQEEAINQLYGKILEQDSENREARVTRLHLLDNDSREERLADVIAAADEVISRVDEEQLERFFGKKRNATTPEEIVEKKEREAEKRDLVDALSRKARALAYQELPEVVEKHPIEDQDALNEAFEATYQALTSWGDTNAPSYQLLKIRHERRLKNYGQALLDLNQYLKSQQASEEKLEKRRDLYELLGWEDLSRSQQNWILRQFPKSLSHL